MGYYCPFCGVEAYWGHRDYKCRNSDCHNHEQKVFGVLRQNRSHLEVLEDEAEERNVDVEIEKVDDEDLDDDVVLYRIQTEIDGQSFGFEIKKNEMRVFEMGADILFDNMERAIDVRA